MPLWLPKTSSRTLVPPIGSKSQGLCTDQVVRFPIRPGGAGVPTRVPGLKAAVDEDISRAYSIIVPVFHPQS